MPAIWGSVPQRNKNFTGRESLLLSLRRRMIGEVTAVLPHALQGLGGVGKTQLAIEYAYRYASDYDVIWWVPADQPVLVRSALAALAPRLELTGIAPERVEDAVRAVLDSLRRGVPYQRWLLIFDNADQPETIRELIPNGPGDVLVTSRNHRWQSIVDTVEVDVFSRQESLEFLRRRVPGSVDDASNRLAEELGDLPLALEQAGALQAEAGMSVAEYLDLLDKEARKLLAENPPSDYPMPVAAAWSLSVARVHDQMPFALDLLRRCAFFGPEPIPLDLLRQGRYVLDSPLREVLGDSILRSRAMRELGRYALARIDNNRETIQVHRLIQRLLRDELVEEESSRIRHEVHLLLAAADPGDPESLKSWPKYQELLAHIGPSSLGECHAGEVRRAMNSIATYLHNIGDYTTCLGEIDRTLKLWSTESGEDQRDVITMLGTKAYVLWSLGRYKKARAIRRRNIRQARRVFGKNHEFTLYTTNGYGADLRALGDFRASLNLDKDLLERHLQVFRSDHPSTHMVANNLALDYSLNGMYPQAREVDERVYQDRLEYYGKSDHPRVLMSLGAIARDMRQAGDYAAAVEIAERVYRGFEDVVRQGPFPGRHPAVLLQSREYSISLRKVGRLQEALVLAEHVYRSYDQVFGAAHPDTLSAAITLFNAQYSAEVFGDSISWIGDVVRRYGEVWGAGHPFTHGCALNLAIAQRVLGDVEGAKSLLAGALVGLESTIGPGHHYTLTCRANLASTIAELGDSEVARELGEKALEQFRMTLGEDHPHTLACAANLAMDRGALGLRREANELAEHARDRLVCTLGEGSPSVQQVVRGERVIFDFEPPAV